MRANEIARLLAQRPFVPLRVHMSSGSIYPIMHPELAFVERIGLVIGLDNTSGLSGAQVSCSWLHIAEIEEVPSLRGEQPQKKSEESGS